MSLVFAEGVPPPFTLPRIGLALGSGAARGWAHIGVIRALEAAGVKVAKHPEEIPSRLQ